MKRTFTGVERWLEIHARNAAENLFEEFGCHSGWLLKSDIAPKLFTNVKSGTAYKYLDALLAYLVAEGKQTGRPQVAVNRGQFTFEPALIPGYQQD